MGGTRHPICSCKHFRPLVKRVSFPKPFGGTAGVKNQGLGHISLNLGLGSFDFIETIKLATVKRAKGSY